MRRRRAAWPVGSDELKDAILTMMVREFGDRPLDWETVARALVLVNFEIKQWQCSRRPREYLRRGEPGRRRDSHLCIEYSHRAAKFGGCGMLKQKRN